MRHDQYIWLNELTAKKFKLQNGMNANVVSRHTVITLPVKINPEIPDCAVLIFYHPSMGHIRNEPVRLECTR
jgi:anaerobic selenocysteine-containing dehydrogenase